MLEVSRREKQAGIVPDPDIDTYMKVTLASPICFPCLWSSLYFFRREGLDESKILRNHDYFCIKSTGFIVKMAHIITLYLGQYSPRVILC